ncbi:MULTISPECIES: DNA-formamidopyrimidine glycosylase family protein [Corynebacterium]|uniref:DNA-(apurinic or apyrimidinic site) lyase n=1 Tax=Corynebacterium striatum TaxID=43770 RepID=A0AAQ1Z6X7_CORST|nr:MULTISPECIES: DNA-formamidopyrimidine glycosylase family protein [Corynebacterium]EEI79235.1 Formamidopyrimidine-DNA glycosylase N-terminal domain protein [Corynebacterium striatum ATCC 6940]MDK8812409.1 DNA-formamidopyrimidine glycosylase family protein [Corynebacterium striatum]OFT53331.1 endonuclease [Corynebacterium sp. HMSC06C06]QQE53053.1 Fpg/Nei family DNA glycosylase [Corynebacterium striatum]STD35313.1 endonuclease VIII [Corynebacterium striatum]
MPEGDSVLQLAERMQFMVGREVTKTSVRVPRYALARFDGMECVAVWPYGKHLFMEFAGDEDEPLILHTHLKMEGQWHIHYAGDRWRAPGHTARVVLQLANEPRDIEIVGHTLGFVEVYPESDYLGRIEHLGPDILDPDWEINGGREEAIWRIEARPERAIGAALLDQKNVAGIGNEYRAEACFIAGMHPAERVGDVDVEKIVDVSRTIMWANRFSLIRVTTGVRRAGETTYVFGRTNARCRRCGTPIEKGVLGGVDAGGDEGELERIIWWCPHCQPGPRGA